MEETIGYEALFDSEDWDSLEFGDWSEGSKGWSLSEPDALKIALALDDYEQVTLTDIGGTDEQGYFVNFRDERFGTQHIITGYFHYWDFIGHLSGYTPWPVKPLREAVV